MTIQDQISLFFRRFNEPSENGRLTSEQALEYINDSRISLAEKIKFYHIKDKITAGGGETYWTFRDDFLGPVEGVREWATYNGYPIIMKPKGEWAELTSGILINIAINANMLGMYDRNIFHINFEASSGDELEWRGYGRPPLLGAVTGVDAYLTSEQAMLTVLDAVVTAKDDVGDRIGQRLWEDYKELKQSIKTKAENNGPRLENAPDE